MIGSTMRAALTDGPTLRALAVLVGAMHPGAGAAPVLVVWPSGTAPQGVGPVHRCGALDAVVVAPGALARITGSARLARDAAERPGPGRWWCAARDTDGGRGRWALLPLRWPGAAPRGSA